jgi:ribosome maturation factor RimP
MTTGTYDKERELTAAITPAVESTLPGVEVLAVELLSPSRFCVYLDRPGGVDLDLCERVTRLLDRYREHYTIDVSSPGPERPLRTERHFAEALGGRVQLRAAGPDGVVRLRGVVTGAGDRAVTLDVEGVEHEIPYEDIVRANLIEEGRKGQ